MADRVKAKRRYDSPRRREQAAATRREILDAAQRLFEQHGYAATTMATIAAEAGVALKTVYVAFETKSGVLRALWHLLLRGDQDDVPVGERRWYREILEEPDPERQLRLTARNSRVVKERAGALMGVIRSAAPSDPDTEALWSRIQTDFYENQRLIVEAVHSRKALRRGLDVAHAADILWTLNHPDLWQLLVGGRGWTPDEWERWFGDAACSQLLG
jgi:AcrR family transcriptional regulator